MLIDERAFPVHPAIENIRSELDRAAHLVAAVRSADRVGMARLAAIRRFGALLRQLAGLDHVLGPAREHLHRVVGVEMRGERARCIETAGERISGRVNEQL